MPVPTRPGAEQSAAMSNRMVLITASRPHPSCTRGLGNRVLDWIVRNCMGGSSHTDCQNAVEYLREFFG